MITGIQNRKILRVSYSTLFLLKERILLVNIMEADFKYLFLSALGEENAAEV